MEFTKEIHESLLNYIEGIEKKIDLVQKLQMEFMRNINNLDDARDAQIEGINNRIESNLKLIKIQADVLFPLSDATKSNFENLLDLSNSNAESMKSFAEQGKSLVKLITQFSTLLIFC